MKTPKSQGDFSWFSHGKLQSDAISWGKNKLFSDTPNSHTLCLFNIAMESAPFIDDFPINTSIYKGISMAMLNNQMVYDCMRIELFNSKSPKKSSNHQFKCVQADPMIDSVCCRLPNIHPIKSGVTIIYHQFTNYLPMIYHEFHQYLTKLTNVVNGYSQIISNSTGHQHNFQITYLPPMWISVSQVEVF